MRGYVYVLRPNMTLNGKSIVKIGMTTRSVEKRVRELSTGSPVSFEVAHSIEVENAREFERTLHRRFASHRISNGGGTEYFSLEPEQVISEIENMAARVSAQRARESFASELNAFKVEIGLAKLTRRIDSLAWWPNFMLFSTGSVLAWSFLRGWGLLLGFLGVAVLTRYSHRVIHRMLRQRLGNPRLDALVDEKRDELAEKYPLALKMVV